MLSGATFSDLDTRPSAVYSYPGQKSSEKCPTKQFCFSRAS